LPPALLQATRLQRLSLRGNCRLRPSEAELQQLLRALPELQLLNLAGTDMDDDVAETLSAAAMERGLALHGYAPASFVVEA